jgi:hypothetical protein
MFGETLNRSDSHSEIRGISCSVGQVHSKVSCTMETRQMQGLKIHSRQGGEDVGLSRAFSSGTTTLGDPTLPRGVSSFAISCRKVYNVVM